MSGERVDLKPSGLPVLHGGSGAGYAKYGCRCDDCRAAERIRKRRLRTSRKSGPVRGEHGKPSTYNNWHCRCDQCRHAWAEEMRRQYADRIARNSP